MADHDEAGEAYEMDGANNFQGILAGGRARIAAGRKTRARTVAAAYSMEAEGIDTGIRADMRDPRYDSTHTPPNLTARVAAREAARAQESKYFGKSSE
jgi:hypothetical protein